MPLKLETDYLGLRLRNPLIAGASPLAFSIDAARRLEDAGVAALVLHSLFEEQIDSGKKDEVYDADPAREAAAFPLSPTAYVRHVERLKEALDIPVIASLNGQHEGGWVRYAQFLQDAGADALELNLYFLPNSDDESSSVVEQRAFQIVRLVRQFVQIPVAVKLSPFFTSLTNFAHRLEVAGANALVLFNRFFQPDLDIENQTSQPYLSHSTPEELLLRLRWLTVLHGRLRLQLSLTGGVHSAEDMVKAIMAGADSVQVVSALMKNGPEYAGVLLKEFEQWMDAHEFESVDQMRGVMSYIHTQSADVVGRANYIKVIQGWRPPQESQT